uniref:C-type lectin domain-containing protein n=1 Tax=Oncorhynchus mykiss TaxID=8022 RepID=A0A8C7T5B7_ONCMY
MQRKSSSTGLLITALSVVVSGLTKQFYYVDKQLTWQGAQQYCREKYIDLAFITDQEEAELFSNVLTSEFNWIGLTWIGLYRETNDSTEWKWSGGWNSTFRFWSKGLPNHLIVNQDCVGVITGEMADSLCQQRNPFWCFDVKLSEGEGLCLTVSFCEGGDFSIRKSPFLTRLFPEFNRPSDPTM